MNPERRPIDDDTREWGRYDVAGHRTVYCAVPEAAAYAESLAAFRPGLVNKHKPDGPEELLISDWFDDEDDVSGDTSILELVRSEWADRHHQPPGSVPACWRHNRLMHTLTLPAAGWFVDIEASRSVATLADRLGARLGEQGLDLLTVGALRGENREITTTIAGWVWHQVLDDGSRPHGIRFGSKHGSDWTCWAVWLRNLDDNRPLQSEPTLADDGQEVPDRHHNPALDEVARIFGLVVH